MCNTCFNAFINEITNIFFFYISLFILNPSFLAVQIKHETMSLIYTLSFFFTNCYCYIANFSIHTVRCVSRLWSYSGYCVYMNIEKPGYSYPCFYRSSPGSKTEFLKTWILAYPGFWNWNMMSTCTKTGYSKIWSYPGYSSPCKCADSCSKEVFCKFSYH